MESAVVKTKNKMKTGETNNSDGGGSRKRKRSPAEDHEKKCSIIYDDDRLNLKLMVPTQTVGALIGKNGETIKTIENETNCRIKISKNKDTFPSTNERVVLINGRPSCVLRVVEFIVDKTEQKYDPILPSDQFDRKRTERWKEIKMIIPNSSAGMIIGKAGEYIKSIKDQTGAFVQISAKEQVDHRSFEQVVTVVGNSPKELLDGVQMIVAKLSLDPNQSSQVYTNLNYSQVIKDLNLHINHYARSNSPSSNCGGDLGCSSSSRSMSSSSSNNSALLNLGNIQVLQFLHMQCNTLRNNGYNESSIAEIMQAMQVLAKYNVLGLGFGFGLPAVSKVTSGDQQPLYVSKSSGSRYNSSGPQPPYRDYASRVVKECKSNKLELAIPDAIVGAVLGKQGRNLLEIQHFSGAKVEVSKKGQYVSGTQDRLITIAGSPDSIRLARMIIEKSINDEQSKRESRR